MGAEERPGAGVQDWGALAPGWERWRAYMTEVMAPVREWLIRELAPRSGETVLELSAGAGETGFAAAAIVGERGRVISTDLSPEMVEVARRRGAELGLRNVEHRVMDAQRIELEADSVDGVLCQSGYMVVADPAAALRETRRVLRPGGRVALSVWGAPGRNPWAGAALRFLVERGHAPPPQPGEPGPFRLAGDGRLDALLRGAGFTEVWAEEVAVRLLFRDLDEYERWVVEVSAAGLRLRGLPEPEREAFRSELAEALAPFAAGAGYELPGVSLAAVAG
jgi:SAM-dependent methyltransferase